MPNRKLRGHARLAPSRILLCHLYDEFADVLRNSWPTSLRLPFPKQLETLAMPANQGLGLTMTKASFQSQRRDQRMRQTRAESFRFLSIKHNATRLDVVAERVQEVL